MKSIHIKMCNEKKESQNGSPRKAVWLFVAQLSMELHFGATLQGRVVSELFSEVEIFFLQT